MLGGHPGPGRRPSPALGALPLRHLRPLRPAGGEGEILLEAAPAPVLPPRKRVFYTLSAHRRFMPGVAEEKKAFPSGALSRVSDAALFLVTLQNERGKRHFGEELQIPGRLSEHGSCPWCGAVGGGMGPRVGIPAGDKSQSIHPSVSEHPEPAQLCSHSLHSWIHPNGEACPGFSKKCQPRASPQHWEDSGGRWLQWELPC